MRQAETLAALKVWLDAGLGQGEWSGALTWSLSVTGARAHGLVLKQRATEVRLLGASVGAPAEFLKLCRDLGAAPCAGGNQERYVDGLGRLAWSLVASQDMSIVLFALYAGEARLDCLGEIAHIAEKCASALQRAEEGRSKSVRLHVCDRALV